MVEPLLTLLRVLFPNDDNLRSVKLGKQKSTNIVRQVFAYDYLQSAVKSLKEDKFSIIIDETPDRSSVEQVALLACYFDLESFVLKNYLIDLVECTDSSAVGLYSVLKITRNGMNIPMENIIGYPYDATNVMFGEHHSVSQLLKKDYNHVKTIKCSCHLIHLASSKAALELPKSLEDLCRDVFSHFSRSSKRQKDYDSFQAFFEMEPLKIPSPGQTRWLSLQACVDRILKQYDALRSYFMQGVCEDPTHSNDRISCSLNNLFTKLYLEFLSFQLERFNSFNRLFQSNKPLLPVLRQEVEWLIRTIASDFMELNYVKKQQQEASTQKMRLGTFL